MRKEIKRDKVDELEAVGRLYTNRVKGPGSTDQRVYRREVESVHRQYAVK